jgi:hypothetical protein
MATHLAAFFQNTFGTSLAELNVVNDTILTKLTTTRFAVPPDYHNVLWAAASGVNLSRAQVRTPTLQVRRISGEIFPRRFGSGTFTLTNLEYSKFVRPLNLTATEDFELLTSDTGGANAVLYGLVALAPDALGVIPAGDVRIVRATASATLVQGAWTLTTPVPDLALEPGQYTLVGFAPISATAVAARALITGQVYRPGVLGLAGTEQAASDFDNHGLNMLNPGNLMGYDMGSFNHLNFPQFEFLANAGDVAETVYLFCVRTGPALGVTTTPSGP